VIPTRPHEEAKPAKMYVARSFDVNQPGIAPEKIVGGVLGGSLMQGHMKVGEEIEISPGRQVMLGNKTEWKNITTSIRSLHSGGGGDAAGRKPGRLGAQEPGRGRERPASGRVPPYRREVAAHRLRRHQVDRNATKSGPMDWRSFCLPSSDCAITGAARSSGP